MTKSSNHFHLNVEYSSTYYIKRTILGFRCLTENIIPIQSKMHICLVFRQRCSMVEFRWAFSTSENSILCVNCICVLIQTLFVGERLRAHFYIALETERTIVFYFLVLLKRRIVEECLLAQRATVNSAFTMFASQMQFQMPFSVEHHGTLCAIEHDILDMNNIHVLLQISLTWKFLRAHCKRTFELF